MYRDRGRSRHLCGGVRNYRLRPIHSRGDLPIRIRCALLFLCGFTLRNRRFPSNSRGSARRQGLACWFQRGGAIPVAAVSKARRPLHATRFSFTRSFTSAITDRLEGLTLISRCVPGFIRVEDARRSSLIRFAFPIGCLVEENRISNFDFRAIKGPAIRQKAS